MGHAIEATILGGFHGFMWESRQPQTVPEPASCSILSGGFQKSGEIKQYISGSSFDLGSP